MTFHRNAVCSAQARHVDHGMTGRSSTETERPPEREPSPVEDPARHAPGEHPATGRLVVTDRGVGSRCPLLE